MLYVEIRVKGHIDEHWSNWFEDLTIVPAEEETVLTGNAADQAALYGVLAKLRDLNLTLISVNQVGPKQPPEEKDDSQR